MEQNELAFTTADNLKLFGRKWRSSKKVRGVVCLIHGIGEHSGRYVHVAQALTNAGFAVLAMDLRGHGLSEGRRGHVPSLEAFFGDIDLLLEEARNLFGGLPLFLYGHSMGGLVLNYVIKTGPSLTGVIVTSPNLKLAFEPPPFKVALGKIMNFFWPTFTQASELDANALSRDLEVVRAYVDDPLVHDRISARLFVRVIYEASNWALAHASEFELPLLLMHGSGDCITSAEGSREFASKAGDNCSLKIWDGFYHELHNEPEKEAVLKFILDWMTNTLEGTS